VITADRREMCCWKSLYELKIDEKSGVVVVVGDDDPSAMSQALLLVNWVLRLTSLFGCEARE